MSTDSERATKRLCDKEKKREERWSFEREGYPIENHLKVNLLEIGFLQGNSETGSTLNLILRLQPVLTDLNNHPLASLDIEIRHKAYTYEEWANYDGQLLKTALADSYSVVSQMIIRDLVLDCKGGGSIDIPRKLTGDH